MADNQFPWLSLLNQDPSAAFYTKLYGQQGMSPNQKDYFRNNFGSSYSGYIGSQGQGLLDAQKQGMSVTDYLNNPNQSFLDYLGPDYFQNQWNQMAPSQRPGGGTARFAPPTRWMR